MTKVTVVIEYADEDYPNGAEFGYGMVTSDLPQGVVTAVHFGDALTQEKEEDE